MAIKRKYPRKKNLVPSRSSRFSKIPDKFQDNDDQTTKAQDKRSDTRIQIVLSCHKNIGLKKQGWNSIIELSQGSWNGGSRNCFPSAEQKYWSEEAKAGMVLSNFHKEAGMVDQDIASLLLNKNIGLKKQRLE
ncbi:hypothetical protein RhiirA1_470825 [Rhizophagus irregularis]|uniref:Uncharacterized protein n=1 Tax=Rhizophagus irregularis TaxID=588596 RepID=A0A2N0R5E6_9GLOM|nr:hypothetical protein RhiirA1_470825 [Rhizophagus irregularis]